MVRFVVRFALASFLLACASLAGAADDSQPKGSLVIIGGNLRPGNAPVWERLIQLAGGKGARIAVIPSAAAVPEQDGKNLIRRLNAYGAQAFFVPVAVKLPGSDYQTASDDPELAELIRSANGAYFVGGDQSRIIRALRHEDGTNTRVLDALWDLYRKGGVIAGSSAGAAIMSSTMFGRPHTVLGTLKLGVFEGKEITNGLGFIGDDVFVDQHLLIRGRFARMIPAMLKKGYKMGLGIDEDTAMVVLPNRDVEIVGYKGALVLDLNNATSHEGAFNVSNVRVSYLDNGDRFNVRTREFTPSEEKAEGKLDPAHPYYREPLFSADILGNDAVVDLMSKLIDSDQKDAVGITLGSPNGVQPDLGFEFRFTRTPDSAGYQAASTDAYSVVNIRLDIRPILIRRPLYQYYQSR